MKSRCEFRNALPDTLPLLRAGVVLVEQVEEHSHLVGAAMLTAFTSGEVRSEDELRLRLAEGLAHLVAPFFLPLRAVMSEAIFFSRFLCWLYTALSSLVFTLHFTSGVVVTYTVDFTLAFLSD